MRLTTKSKKRKFKLTGFTKHTQKNHPSTFPLLGIMIVILLVGIYFFTQNTIHTTHASVLDSVRIESETASLSGSANVITDANASNSKAVQFDSNATISAMPTPTIAPSSKTLPGQQTWNNGVSSYIFGANDSGEWGTPNLEFTDSQTAPGRANTVVQNMVKKSGFSLLRKFIPHHDFAYNTSVETSDAQLQAISNTFTSTNTQCFITFPDVSLSATSKQGSDKYTDLQFAQHVVTLFDGTHPGYIKCNMFEISNEPDINGIDTSQYLSVWNTYVSSLKAIQPNAKFIGPVVAGYNPDYIVTFLQGVVNNHYVLPDAISWHYYPCGWGTEAAWTTCLSDMSGSTPDTYFNNIVHETTDIRAKIQGILGYQLPIGISEWSVDPNGSMQDTEPQMSQFVTKALNDMVTGKLDFSNIYDLQSFACWSGCDMITNTNTPKPVYNAFVSVLSTYIPTATPSVSPVPTSGSGCTVMPSAGAGRASITGVTLPSVGTYTIYTRMNVPSNGNGYYIQVDNQCPELITDIVGTNAWDWIQMNTPFAYTANTVHTITLYGRDAHVKVDELLFSQSCSPTGDGSNCLAAVNVPPTATPTPSPSAPIPTIPVGTNDITKPVVSFTYPVDQSVVKRNTRITLLANASDNVGVTKVRFYTGSKLLCTVAAAPYICVWSAPRKSGAASILKTVAYDKAGNTSSTVIQVYTK